MADRSEVYRRILRHYDFLRTQVQREAEERRQALYQRIPRLEEIDQELRLLGVETAKQALRAPKEAEQTLQTLRQNQQRLKAEKEALYRQHQIPLDYCAPRYHCLKCQDTGFVDGVACSCFSRALVEEAYASSNLSQVLGEENFDHFSLDYYSPDPYPGEACSPRENINRILAVCLRFTKNFGKETNHLLLYGSPGLGKTFLCSAMAKELLDRGIPVFYATAPALFLQLEKEQFREEAETEPEGFFAQLLAVELLIIDDLGTEFFTSFTASRLFALLNTRLLWGKSTIISTNLSLADLAERYTDRVASRLMGNFTALKFYGDDIRLLKKFARP